MMNEQKVPQLRFSGFEDEWEEKIFQDLFERRMERNNGQFGYDRWISVAKMYFQEPEKVTSNNIDTRTYVMRKSDIAFEGHSNKEFKLGRFVENDIGDGVISELFPIYKHKDEYNLSYWKYAIQNENIMFPKLTKCIEVSYTSSNKLDENFFLNEKILVPIVREQQKIGFFLSQIDTLIQTKTQKLESLKSVKKSLLQKCFPKDGETVPQMRFDGFSGDWEEKKFGDVVTRVTESSDTPQLPRVEYEDILSEGQLREDFFTKSSSKRGIHFRKNHILFGKLRAYLRNNILATFEGIAVGDFWVLETKQLDSKFLFIMIGSNSFQEVANISAGSKMPRSDWSLVSDYNLFLPPTLAEQQKIGQFFSRYDSLISLQQKEIDKLKTIKKSLLQKMFV